MFVTTNNTNIKTLGDSLVFQDSVHFSSAVKLCMRVWVKSIFSGVSRSPLILLVMLTNTY